MTIPDFENKELEKLAQMIARGFDDVYTRFDAIEGRLAALEARVESLDERVGALEKDIATLRRDLDELTMEVRTGFRDVRRDIHQLSEKSIPLSEQDEIWQRIRRIEDHVGLQQNLKTA